MSDPGLNSPAMDVATALADIRKDSNLSDGQIAQLLGVSRVAIDKWERRASTPSPSQTDQIFELQNAAAAGQVAAMFSGTATRAFSSKGVRRYSKPLPLFAALLPKVSLSAFPLAPIITRLKQGKFFAPQDARALARILAANAVPAPTLADPLTTLVTAGKNTYTYDAHTYHTKVPPQGIAGLMRYYLPHGGLVLDPFAGSGMTGVAARVNGFDCVLNELSPAACFIANQFTGSLEPDLFRSGVKAVLDELADLRQRLYTTNCRECGAATEILYTVWSYRVVCNYCEHEFRLWDHCRSYGKTVREHKILGEFPCPACSRTLVKSKLRRTVAEPVELGYKCCKAGAQEITHPLNEQDLALIRALDATPPLAEGFYPQNELPDGVNLRQPKRHGLDHINLFYTPRNLAAMSHIWRTIHRVEDRDLAAYLAFVFTSLYQRVTRLSEFRFWGGSGNTARFNVPFIFNEANVFLTFARKARSIQDHLESTAAHYAGTAMVIQNSATNLDFLPDESVDFIFTDPPFGANINYSEMNYLWESWLHDFTATQTEAIVSWAQGKGIAEYQDLLTQSLRECFRVLRSDHWMLLVFMNSSKDVWSALQQALADAGFEIRQANIFDKEHGTFEQFASDNAVGCDLVLHCLKPAASATSAPPRQQEAIADSIHAFLSRLNLKDRRSVYLHVAREEETDARSLYSEWTAQAIMQGTATADFADFRALVAAWLATHPAGETQPGGAS